MRRVPLLIAALALLLVAPGLAGEGSEPQADVAATPGAALPKGLGEILTAEFPELEVPALAAFDPALVRALGPTANPARAEGDFDGDGRSDTALLLAGAGEHRVVVFLAQKPGAWEVHLLDRRPGRLTPESYIRARPPGPCTVRSADPGGTEGDLDLLHHGLEIGRWKDGASITFWTGGVPVTHPLVRSLEPAFVP